MAGSKALTDRKKQKELVEKLLVDRAPRSVKAALDYMDRDFDGGESGIVRNPDTGEPILDKNGNQVTYMTNSDIEKMKLSHKIFHKYFDKILPSKIIIEKHEEKFIDERFNKAIDLIMQQDEARLKEEEREIKEIHGEVVD